MLHLKSEQNCVTEMLKEEEEEEEDAPFLSLAAGGAPRSIQMLLTQPKTQGHVCCTRMHLCTQNSLNSPASPDLFRLVKPYQRLLQ